MQRCVDRGSNINSMFPASELASINRPDCVTNPLNRKYGFVWKSAIICENPQIFVAQVHKYFCFLRHSFGPSPDVYNNVLPLDLPTVYCPELDRGSFKEASWNFYPLDTLFVRVHFEHFLPTRTKLKCMFLTKTLNNFFSKHFFQLCFCYKHLSGDHHTKRKPQLWYHW